MTQPRTMTVRSVQGDYEVIFGVSARGALDMALAGPHRKLVVVDRHVLALYPDALAPGLSSVPTFELDADEAAKGWDSAGRLLAWMQAQGCDRATRLLAIGGGIVQDLVTFCAHVYYRGVPWTFLPTTLLAMADSCIGAKGNLNLGSYKNQLGAFHAPTSVVLATEFVRTLTDVAIASGWGEIVKLAFIEGEEAFARVEAQLESDGLRGSRLGDAIFGALATKRAIIENDEQERGPRLVLNFGHTFGHALESATEHAVPHGLAVAWGVDVACFVAAREGRMSRATFERVHALITRHLLVAAPRVGAAELMSAIRRDKKAAAGAVTLVLPSGVGRVSLERRPIDERLETAMGAYLAEFAPLP